MFSCQTGNKPETDMDLDEWAAIRALEKRGDGAPLRQRLTERGHGPDLIDAFTNPSRGIIKRRRKRQRKTIDPALIFTMFYIGRQLEPTRKITSIHAEIAERCQVSVKTVEKVLYSIQFPCPKKQSS
uniref:hypothetical protein n=1 Tax=Nitrospira cf. moscoviensis SBR1015 TaxID=96242 RepID=UPI00117E088D|nr:hypothetical protein [Nitrospira cf. moscoviensis SBR1015]